MYTVVFIDTEVSVEREIVVDYGAAVDRNTHIHTKSLTMFLLTQTSANGCYMWE